MYIFYCHNHFFNLIPLFCSVISRLSLLFIFIALAGSSQNLIQNGSFELSLKPVKSKYAGNIEHASPWFPVGIGSPDLINQVEVPYGNQNAHTGKQFAGIILYDGDNPEFREYLEVRLSRKLIRNERICLKVWISAADDCRYFTDALGFYLSPDSLISRDWNTVEKSCDLHVPKFSALSDTSSSWRELSFEFVAQGEEEFLSIGNFKRDASTLLQSNNREAFLRLAYIYLDDLYLGSCEPEKTQNTTIEPVPSDDLGETLPASKLHVPNVVTPNGDGFNDLFFIQGIPRYSRMKIRAKNGTIVYQTNNYKNDWDGSGLPGGTYTYELTLPDGNRITGPVDVVRRK